MSQRHSQPNILARSTSLLLLVSLLALVALAVAQCKLAGDRVTGLGTQQGLSPCVTDCVNTANDLIRQESVLHKANVKACGSDQTCLDQEEARHAARVDQIQADRDACTEACEHQGSGTGG